MKTKLCSLHLWIYWVVTGRADMATSALIGVPPDETQIVVLFCKQYWFGSCCATTPMD